MKSSQFKKYLPYLLFSGLFLTLCSPAIAQSLSADPLGDAYGGMTSVWPTVKNIGKWVFLVLAVVSGCIAGYQIFTGENKNGRALTMFATFLVFAVVFWLIIP